MFDLDSREKRTLSNMKFLPLRNVKQETKEKPITNLSLKFENVKMKMGMTKAEHEIVKYGNKFAFGFVLDILRQKMK